MLTKFIIYIWSVAAMFAGSVFLSWAGHIFLNFDCDISGYQIYTTVLDYNLQQLHWQIELHDDS